MTTILDVSERDQVARLDDAIERWLRVLREEAETIDPGHLELFVKTTKRLAHRLAESLPPNLDPAALAEIRGILLNGIRRLEESDDSRPLDILNDFMVRAESIRHILRDALDEDIECDPKDARAVAGLLVEWLPRVTRKEIAQLVGVDVRTFHRWLASGGDTPRRLYLVARLAALLRHSWTPQGVIAWFYRSRRDLQARSPADVLDDPTFERDLVVAARQGRAQHGS